MSNQGLNDRALSADSISASYLSISLIFKREKKILGILDCEITKEIHTVVFSAIAVYVFNA